MNAKQKTSVAIVEDNKALGESLRKIVESSDDFICSGVWNTGEDALKKIEAFRPQVVLMDINLPGISGIEVTARIKQHLPEILIVMITVYGDHDKIFEALKAGASGYLLKRSSPAEVRDAIRDVITGGAPMTAEIARRVVSIFHQPQEEEPNKIEGNITPRETEILELLSQGLANKEIADQLNISVETVRVHVKNIYSKLHVHSRVEAAILYRDDQKKSKWLK